MNKFKRDDTVWIKGTIKEFDNRDQTYLVSIDNDEDMWFAEKALTCVGFYSNSAAQVNSAQESYNSIGLEYGEYILFKDKVCKGINDINCKIASFEEKLENFSKINRSFAENDELRVSAANILNLFNKPLEINDKFFNLGNKSGTVSGKVYDLTQIVKDLSERITDIEHDFTKRLQTLESAAWIILEGKNKCL